MPSDQAVAPDRELRSAIERRTYMTYWGQRRWVIPRLVDRVFGDGRKLLGLSPIMFRPHYFVVRIDSAWSLSNCDADASMPPEDWLDDVYDAIEEQFVEWPWAQEYGFIWHEDETADCDSRVSFDDGRVWWEMYWPMLTSEDTDHA